MICSDVKQRFLYPLSAVLAFAWSNPASADMVYGVSGVGGAASALYMQSYTNGVGQPSGSGFTTAGAVTLGTNGAVLSLTGIAYVNGTLYGVTNSMGGSVNGIGGNGAYENTLVTIAPNGSATLVAGNLGAGAQVQALAYDSTNGNLYGFSKSGVGSSPVANSLVQIFTSGASAGLASQVGSGTGITQTSTTGFGLAFDSSGNGYLSPFTVTSPTNGAMYSLPTTGSPPTPTGTASAGEGFTSVPLPSSNMKALAFDSSGTFYGLNFEPNTTTDLVALTNTGSSWQLTNLGTTTPNGGSSVPFVGIAFAPAAVPEPGSFVLVGLGAAGMVVRLFARRRRLRSAAREDTSNQGA